jgi:competence protein ComEA
MPFKPHAHYATLTLASCLLLISTTLIACHSAPAVEISISTRMPEPAGSIYIGGAVNNPGLYPLEAGDSLEDLISAAGGLKAGADPAQMTLSITEPNSASSPQRIDINHAEAWLLAALPGIGDVSARNIIAYREANGPFRSAADLLNVKGIGPATLDKIKDYITVAG